MFTPTHFDTSVSSSHPRRVTLPPESHGPTKVHDVTSQTSDTATRTSRTYQSKWRHIPEEWHCRQNLKDLPKYMTSHPRGLTLPPEPHGSTKVHDVTSQKSDIATRIARLYQSTWRHIPEEWHYHQNLTALPKYKTSHPRRVTLPPEPHGPTKIHDVTSRKSDTATRIAWPYPSTWRHIPEERHSRQNLKAPAYLVNIVMHTLWTLHNRKNW